MIPTRDRSQPPQLRAVLVIVEDGDQRPVVGARVVVDDVVPPGPHVGQTDAQGFAMFPEVTRLPQSHLTIEADGFVTYSHHLDLPPENVQIRVGMPMDPSRPHDVVLEPMAHVTSPIQPRPPLPPFPTGSYDRVLPWDPPHMRDFIRADSWAVPVPNLPFVSGGSSEHPERLLTPFLYKYDRALWPACFKAHKKRSYTHWILWWPNFRADGGSIFNFVALCREIQAEGFYVQVGLNSKEFDPRDQTASEWKVRLDQLFDALAAAKVADEFAVWEWDSHNIPGRPTIDAFKHFGQRAHAMGASFWAHFYPEHTSWFADGDSRGRYGFWSDLGADVDGLQYQTGSRQGVTAPWTIEETQARLVDTLSQFGSQGNQHKLRFFEDLAWLQFSRDRDDLGQPVDEDAANLRGYLACCTVDNVKHTDAKIWGYGNGGRRPDGSPL